MKQIYVPTADTFPKTADAVVIGGGIVGTATAFWLSRAGLDTVLVEMREGLSTLTTPNSIESFRAQFTETAMSEIAVPSIEIFENFSEVVGISDIVSKMMKYPSTFRHTRCRNYYVRFCLFIQSF